MLQLHIDQSAELKSRSVTLLPLQESGALSCMNSTVHMLSIYHNTGHFLVAILVLL
jgi:hypothetical protein